MFNSMKAGSWAQIDATANPNYFVDFLDNCSANAQIQDCKRNNFELLDLFPGHRVLSAGCGTGEDVIELAKRVGSAGVVFGIDSSALMVKTAKRRNQPRITNIDYQIADIHDLRFFANSFDRCCADRVFQHLENPAKALLELKRVLKPGGLLLISDPDWLSLTISSSNIKVTNAVLRAVQTIIPNYDIARQLPKLIETAAMEIQTTKTVEVVLTSLVEARQLMLLEPALLLAVANEWISEKEAWLWQQELIRQEKEGKFFAKMFGVAVLAEK